jgi:hypothetical protein
MSARGGRSGPDGTGQSDEYLNPGSSRVPVQIAVNATHVFMATMTDIVRANLTGSPAPTVIPAAAGPSGIAVNSSYVYWTVGGFAPAIMRAGLEFGSADTPVTLMSGLTAPASIAVADTAIFWSIGTPATDIAKAAADGSGRNPSFVQASSRGMIRSLAVGTTTAAPTPAVRTTDLKACNTLKQTGPNPTIAVTVRITNSAVKRTLSTTGRLRATICITATSTAGQAGTATRATTLVAPKKAAKAAYRR